MFQFDFGFIAKNVPAFILIVFTFLYTDIFDTVGTLIGVAEKESFLIKTAHFQTQQALLWLTL